VEASGVGAWTDSARLLARLRAPSRVRAA